MERLTGAGIKGARAFKLGLLALAESDCFGRVASSRGRYGFWLVGPSVELK